jgi:hypothetical protein
VIKLNSVIVAAGIEVLPTIDVMKHNQISEARNVFADDEKTISADFTNDVQTSESA